MDMVVNVAMNNAVLLWLLRLVWAVPLGLCTLTTALQVLLHSFLLLSCLHKLSQLHLCASRPFLLAPTNAHQLLFRASLLGFRNSQTSFSFREPLLFELFKRDCFLLFLDQHLPHDLFVSLSPRTVLFLLP
jgi:hypothetical protein